MKKENLVEFLAALHPVLSEEAQDFETLCADIAAKNIPVSFMPCVTFDLWPVYALQCTNANVHIDSYNGSMFYIAPIGEHDFYLKPHLEQIMTDFYKDDFDDFGLMYGGELEEMLLLESQDIGTFFKLGDVSEKANAVYMGFSMPNGAAAHILFLLDSMVNTWENCFEKYSVNCDALIDSHKGMGDWFDTTPLYSYFQSTQKKELLPKLYFKGKYISHEAPKGYKLIHSVEESRDGECVSELYITDYDVKN
ncbi:MAG: hypothetical protein E7598_03635 [Ruminococcaceae bacterium]|nr:hypothetical protein [Oscillospiraceae bacterium]